MAHPPPPPPKSLLGRHRLLSPSASIRVSPICLGSMNFGTKWTAFMGECSKENAFELLDTFYDLGGNFIDTANGYQGGQSEEWIGEWMEKTGHRDEMVISTKYLMEWQGDKSKQQTNFGGTGTKSMFLSLEASLKKLRTEYVDVLYVHGWDYSTEVAELMQSLNVLVQQRKVLYLGISDSPAWIVVKCNAYAREHGLRPFSVYQGKYSAQSRDLERDVIPMCKAENMGIMAWGVLGNGWFKAPGEGEKTEGRQAPFPKVGREEQVGAVMDKVAKRLNVPMTAIAIAYAMHKTPYLFPILGGRKVSHMKSNVEALGVRLSPEDVAEIETGYKFEPGFPHDALGGGKPPQGPQDVTWLKQIGFFDHVISPSPIKPHQGDLGARFEA